MGKLGADLDVAAGYDAARGRRPRHAARIRPITGSLDRVARIVKALGMVNAAPDFTRAAQGDPDGFSDLMVEVFGEAGRGARAAVGMATLSGGMAVEIEMVVELKP